MHKRSSENVVLFLQILAWPLFFQPALVVVVLNQNWSSYEKIQFMKSRPFPWPKTLYSSLSSMGEKSKLLSRVAKALYSVATDDFFVVMPLDTFPQVFDAAAELNGPPFCYTTVVLPVPGPLQKLHGLLSSLLGFLGQLCLALVNLLACSLRSTDCLHLCVLGIFLVLCL